MASRAEAPARRGDDKGVSGQQAASRKPLQQEICGFDGNSRGGGAELAPLPEDAPSAVRALCARIVEVAKPRLSAMVGRLNKQPAMLHWHVHALSREPQPS